MDQQVSELNYQIKKIGELPRGQQAGETQGLALQVQKLPQAWGAYKVIMAVNLVWSSAADDARTLQVETETLAEALHGWPQTDYSGRTQCWRN